jgi:hypothetical protein
MTFAKPTPDHGGLHPPACAPRTMPSGDRPPIRPLSTWVGKIGATPHSPACVLLLSRPCGRLRRGTSGARKGRAPGVSSGVRRRVPETLEGRPERARDQRRHWLPLAEAKQAPPRPPFRALQVRRDRRHETRNARKAGLISASTFGYKASVPERKGAPVSCAVPSNPATARERRGWLRPASATC